MAEEDRRRRNDHDDSKRRQQIQFASEEHALMLEKERSRLKLTDSTVQHNQMMQMIALSQRSNDLALVMKHATSQQNFNEYSGSSAHVVVGGPKKSTATTESKGRVSANNDQVSLLQDLKKQLQEEKDLQDRLRSATASVMKYADDEGTGDEEVDSSYSGEASDDEDNANMING